MATATNQWNPWNWFKEEGSQNSRNSSQSPFGSLNAINPLLSQFSPSAYWGPVSNFYRDFDKMVETTFRNLSAPFPAFPAGLTQAFSIFRPVVDVASSENEYIITAEVPGLDENDIRLELAANNTLCIKGEKRQQREDNNRDYQSSERTYGAFTRVLALPEDADKEGIEAEFENGLLTVIVPRIEMKNMRPREIEISAGSGEGGQRRTRRSSERGSNSERGSERGGSERGSDRSSATSGPRSAANADEAGSRSTAPKKVA